MASGKQQTDGSFSIAAFVTLGAVAFGIVACGGHSSSPLPGTAASGFERVPAARALRPGPRVAPAGAGRTELAQLRAPASRGFIQEPIADEALQIGHAYPHHERWFYGAGVLDPSCGELEWSYHSAIPGETVSLDPAKTALDGKTEVSFGKIPDDVKPGAYKNSMEATCTNPKATGVGPGTTPISVAAVSLDIAVVPQDGGDGQNVTDTTFTEVAGKFVELDASPEPEVTLLQDEWHVPGDTVRSYSETKTKASYTALSPSDLAQQQLNFYWIHSTGGAKLPLPLQVVFPTFNGKCAPDACTGAEAYWGLAEATADVTVVAPTVDSIVSSTGVVAVDAKSGQSACLEALHYGYLNTLKARCAPPGAVPGIRWTATVRVPVGAGGDLDATQLIDRKDTVVPLKGARSVPTPYPGTNGLRALDGCIHVGNASGAHEPIAQGGLARYEAGDSPGLALRPGWSAFTDADEYLTYFVYKPTDSTLATPDRLNIWVPIGYLKWNWAGTAASAPTWHLTAESHTANPRGVIQNDLPLPAWTSFYEEKGRTCPAGG
jgi:hypothetical protein